MTEPENRAGNKFTAFRLSKGDLDAFEKVYDDYRSDVLRYLLALCGGNGDLAEELLQQTFVRLWINRSSVDPDKIKEGVKFFIIRIARNLWFNHQKHELVKDRYEKESLLNPQELSKHHPEQNIYQQELGLAVETAILKLDEPAREAFVLNRYENLTYNQIAEIQGVSFHTVSARIQKAIENLKKDLNNYFPKG